MVSQLTFDDKSETDKFVAKAGVSVTSCGAGLKCLKRADTIYHPYKPRGHIAMRHSVAKMEKAIEAAKLKPAEDTRVSLGLAIAACSLETSLHNRNPTMV